MNNVEYDNLMKSVSVVTRAIREHIPNGEFEKSRKLGYMAASIASSMSPEHKVMAQENAMRLLIMTDLYDPEKTTPEERDAFFNRAINLYIEQLFDHNKQALRAHVEADCGTEGCVYDRWVEQHGAEESSYQVLYKRVFSQEPTVDNGIESLPDLMVNLVDRADGEIAPISIALHPIIRDRKSVV